eukprot:6152645-Amphidinium_carterae.1
MAFAKAGREKHALTGSDDARAPDYVKLPALQPRREEQHGCLCTLPHAHEQNYAKDSAVLTFAGQPSCKKKGHAPKDAPEGCSLQMLWRGGVSCSKCHTASRATDSC